MPVDLRRVVRAAVRAAMEEPDKSKQSSTRPQHLGAGGAVMLGAGLVTAGRLLTTPKGRELLGSVHDRLSETEWYRSLLDEDADDDPDVEYDEEDPEAAGDEEFDDEEDDEPDDEDDEDLDEEDEDLDEEDEEDLDEDDGDEEDLPRRRRRPRSRA